MESATKNHQPIETLRAMVARGYGPDQVQDGARRLGERTGPRLVQRGLPDQAPRRLGGRAQDRTPTGSRGDDV